MSIRSEDSSFNVISWNMATNSDYISMEEKFDKHLVQTDGRWQVLSDRPTCESREAYETHRNEVDTFRQQKIKNILNAFAKDVPIFCFQEVERDWNVEQILPENFTFIRNGDQVIAWDAQRFTFSEMNYEQILANYQKACYQRGEFFPRFALSALKSTQTGQRILLCSAHITGCDPDYPPKEDAITGDNEIKTIGELIKDLSIANKLSGVIIGVDANVTREYSTRLGQLRNMGFKVDEAKFATNVNFIKYDRYLQKTSEKLPLEGRDNPQQKIDYIAVLGGEVNPPDDEMFCSEGRSVPLQNLERNPSDHVPLIQRVSITAQEQGIFGKLISWFYS